MGGRLPSERVAGIARNTQKSRFFKFLLKADITRHRQPAIATEQILRINDDSLVDLLMEHGMLSRRDLI